MMDNQLQYYLHLRHQWQKQYQQNTQRQWEFRSTKRTHRLFKALMSRWGKQMVKVGRYLQTVGETSPPTRRAHI